MPAQTRVSVLVDNLRAALAATPNDRIAREESKMLEQTTRRYVGKFTETTLYLKDPSLKYSHIWLRELEDDIFQRVASGQFSDENFAIKYEGDIVALINWEIWIALDKNFGPQRFDQEQETLEAPLRALTA
jgi:hypothetical protein